RHAGHQRRAAVGLSGRRQGLRQQRPAILADRARNHARHSLEVQPQGAHRARSTNLSAAQCRRTHVLPLQGLAPRRHPLRPQHQHLHGHHRHRRRRHMVAPMSPDPNSVSLISPHQNGRGRGMQASNRIDMVDALRGYALFGLFMVHCVESFELYWLDPQPDPWFDGTMAVFAGKAFAIFALLFGFSFATIMTNERKRGGDFTWRFAWRLALLFAIGTLHALVYRGDILQVLAAVGLIMIPFDRLRSDRAALVIALLLFLQLPLL